jgi:hypothetical protein
VRGRRDNPQRGGIASSDGSEQKFFRSPAALESAKLGGGGARQERRSRELPSSVPWLSLFHQRHGRPHTSPCRLPPRPVPGRTWRIVYRRGPVPQFLCGLRTVVGCRASPGRTAEGGRPHMASGGPKARRPRRHLSSPSSPREALRSLDPEETP